MHKIFKISSVLVFLVLLRFFASAQSAQFTYQSSNNLFCAPATINFTQMATGNPVGYSWSFGNGTFSNAPNPSVVYSAPGSYTVTLTAIFENTTAQSSQVITINPSVTVTATANRNYICTPGTINFTANTSTPSIISYSWDFGDGSGIVVVPTNTISHNFTAFGNYNVTVTATTSFGCTGSSGLAVQVQKTPISGTVSPTSGCIPANVNYTATANLPIGSNVSNYLWDFGDGVTQNTASGSTTHTYSLVGSFNATVTVTTNEGCVNTFNYPAIAFGTPSTDISAYTVKPVICGSETSVFVAHATNANTYVWNFGDGIVQTVSDTIITHKYATLGIKNVVVTPFFNGCAGSSQSLTVNVIGVIVGFNFANTCTNRDTYSFTNTTQGNVSAYLWMFGDASPNATIPNPIHTYPPVGQFNTSLLVVDNTTGCRDSVTKIIYTANPTVTNPDTSICRNSISTFTINNNYTTPGASYTWNVLGQVFTGATSVGAFPASIFGTFNTNFVIINYGPESCPDTLYLNHPISVRGPNINFSFPTPICANSNILITNTTAPFRPQDSINLLYFNYGLSATNDTIYQPQPVTYNNPGAYNIKLVAKDNKGCIDSVQKQLIVNPLPFLRVIPRHDTLCLGQSDSLIAFHEGTLQWSNAATLSCATCDTTIATPTMTTDYVATATNVFGCITRDTASLVVYQPFVASIPRLNTIICLNETTQLDALPFGKVIRWSPPVSISDTTIYNPIVNPVKSTLYTATLTDSVGCFSSTASVLITVKSLPTVNAGPDQLLPYASNFTINPLYSNNVRSYLWTPASQLNCATCPSPSGIALMSQLYVIKATSDSNCVAFDSIRIIIECKYANVLLPTAFTPNSDARNNYFYPMTRGIKQVKSFIIFNRFGQKVYERKNFLPNVRNLGWDGTISNIPQDRGNYVYMLEVECDQGDTLVKKGSILLLR